MYFKELSSGDIFELSRGETHNGLDLFNKGQAECLALGYRKEPRHIPVEVQRKGMVLSPLQFRKGINSISQAKRDQLDSYVETLTQDEKDEWRYAPYFERLSPLILKLQVVMGVTDAQLDAFFKNHST